jgi:hypothetical protein
MLEILFAIGACGVLIVALTPVPSRGQQPARELVGHDRHGRRSRMRPPAAQPLRPPTVLPPQPVVSRAARIADGARVTPSASTAPHPAVVDPAPAAAEQQADAGAASLVRRPRRQDAAPAA